MNSLTVLIQGYVKRLPGGSLKASPSTVLIRTPDKTILVDPGANLNRLKLALQKKALRVGEIDSVFLTHYHPDHLLNIRLFPAQEVFDGTTRYLGDIEIPYKEFIPGTDIQVLPTPGHTPEHASLIVNTAEGRFAITGDLFWWEDGQPQNRSRNELLNLVDPFATNLKQLRKSRARLLDQADFFIPGHGKMFQPV